jgi:hypothetical protein
MVTAANLSKDAGTTPVSRRELLRRAGSIAAVACGVRFLAAAEPACRPVTPAPEAIREKLKLAPFYQKYMDAGGLPVVGSARVSDFALREAVWIIEHVLGGRGDILRAMAENRVRVAVMAWNEFTTDIPEHSHLRPKAYWDRRARGLGATRRAPAVSCAEENLLCFPGDPYARENILIHEFAHTIHETGLSTVDPTFDPRLRAAFEHAKGLDLWAKTYARVDRKEYWAEGVQCWFDNNRENDACHGPVNTRAELKEYDPELAKLCAEILGDGPWRYHKPRERDEAGRAHLAGWDPAHAPRFHWREEPPADQSQARIRTEVRTYG